MLQPDVGRLVLGQSLDFMIRRFLVLDACYGLTTGLSARIHRHSRRPRGNGIPSVPSLEVNS